MDRADNSTPLLLKPTGVPVFKPVDTIKTTNNQCLEKAAESKVEGGSLDFDFQRTVKAQSIVIGKKVQNSTGINLLDTDNAAAVQEKQFPVKIIYVKPTHAYQSANRLTTHDENKENHISKSNTDTAKTIKVNHIKVNGIADQSKLKELKHRPKSATTQQLNKNQVQRTKLGPNADIKPQISYVSKLTKQQPRPQSAKPQLTIKKKPEVVVVSPKKETEIPFAQNRYQGQFGNLTKDLFKKAQEALMAEQQQMQKQKEDLKNNKQKIKQLAEEHKKMNQDLVQKQKEKGVERVDFRKKEEEKKEKARNQENNQERQKVREAREKRKQESRKQLGLDMFSEGKVVEYRNKVKAEIESANPQPKIVKLQRPQSQDTQGAKKQLAVRNHSALNRDMKELIQEGNKIDQEEEKQERDKKEILREMKLKRKLQKQEKKKKEEDEASKKLENMKLLEEKLRLQKEEYFKRKELQARLKEEQKRLQQEQEEQAEQMPKKKKKKPQQAKSSHKEQLDDLRNWIEEQMLKEDLKTGQDGDAIEELEEPDQSFEQPQIMVKIDKKQESFNEESQETSQVNQMKLLKHMLPGNHLLSEKEESKLKGRTNRYGVAGDNGYGQVVEIQRQKMEPKKAKSHQQSEKKLSKEETKKVKTHLANKVKELSSKVNLEVVDITDKEEREEEEDYSQYSQQLEMYDLEPVREVDQEPQRTVIIAKANKSPSKKEIQKSQSKDLNSDLPGVLNIEKELKRQQLEKLKRESEATVVIQKWTRGFLARHALRQAREDRRKEIEEEYSYFEDQIKFNADYNFQKFLKDKQTLREKNKTTQIEDSNSIKERIGESSSGQFTRPEVQKHDGVPALLQNFFKTPSDKDPLSLISIFAKRSAPQVVLDEAIPDETEHLPTKKSTKKHIETDSDIAESIEYSENFEHPSKKSASSDIAEEIEGSKGFGSSSGSVPNKQKGAFPYKAQSSIAESIQEDYLLSVDHRSRRSPDRESSIAEESHLMSASRASGSHKKKHSRSSIIEDIEGEYSEDKFDSYRGSRQNLNIQQKKEHDKQVKEFQEKIKQDESKRKAYVNEFLTELNRYEQAHISSTMVERVEKIITQSLAQKDKLILAQRLHELEAEKKHKDEINKIREEQIKLMSQLMLVGGTGSNSMNEQERQQVLENIQKIIDKPIVIEQVVESESSKVYEEKESVDFIEESRTLQTLQVGRQKQTDEDSIQESIMEEDIPEGVSFQSKEDEEEEIKESVYVDGQKQVEKGLQMARITLGSEEAVRQQAKQTLEGGDKQAKAGTFDKHSFQDFTQQQFKKMMFIDPSSMSTYMQQIEQQIIEKSEKAHKKLKHDKDKKLISPRTYKTKQQELEKWVTKEKQKLQRTQQNMLQSAEEVAQLMTKLGTDRKSMLEKIGSPRGKRVLDINQSQSSVDYDDIEEESNDSIRVRAARNQLRNVQRNLKYEQEDEQLVKKKVTAKKLLQEKEKAIQEGIKQKMKNIEAEYVDELLNEALNLDVDREIEKRIRGARQAYDESNNFTESSQFPANQDSISQSARSLSQSQPDPAKKKKKVNFASPPSESKDRFSSVHSYQDSVEFKSVKSQHRFEESIGESIKIEESYQISQPSLQQESNKTTSNQRDSVKESIKESNIEESVPSSHYSEDFISQSIQSDASKGDQMLQSRNKLQAKAETLEDQNDYVGYSMNFDEDSMGQSQQFGTVGKSQQLQSSNEKNKVEERVEEEQVEESLVDSKSKSQIKESLDQYASAQFEEDQDESYYEESKGSQQLIQSKHSNQPDDLQQSESEGDKEVLYSAKSVEWQINLEQQQQLLQESARFKKSEASIEDQYSENFDEEPLESERQTDKEQDAIDELNDLESFPDEIEDSFNDFQAKADLITDELLDLVLQEFKADPSFHTKPVVDEQQFKDKFPYTLDIPAPEPVEEPIVFKSLQQPQQIEVKVKPNIPSQEELMKKQHEEQQQIIKESQEKVKNYLSFLIKQINKQELIASLEKPIEVDPLKVLARIQAFENDESVSFNNLNETAHSQAVLPFEFYIDSEKEFRDQNGQGDLTESQTYRYEQNDHKAIFDAFNDALDQERPYKQKGLPAPWSKQTRMINPKITVAMVDKMLNKAQERVMQWAKTGAGTKYAPLPPPPAAASNEFDQPQEPQRPIQSEDERRNALREERLGELLTKEIEENDALWVDYEIEDAQVKFDLADMVLEHLASEVAEMLLRKTTTTTR